MLSSLVPLVLLTAVAAPPTLDNGTQLLYRGSLVADKGAVTDSEKPFKLTFIATGISPQGATLYWTLDEPKRGAWPWTDHFGRWQLDAQLGGDTEIGPALLYEREEGLSVVPLVAPLVKPEQPLAQDLSWAAGRLQHEVTATEKKVGQDCWRIEVTSPFGRKRTLWVAKESPVVVAMNETVFIGQGEQHTLQIELAETKSLDAADLQNTIAAFNTLVDLRDKLEVKPRSYMVDWNAEQIAALKAELPAIAKLDENGPLAPIVEEASRDTSDQKTRSSAVAAMQKRVVGREVGEFKLAAISGDALTHESLKNSVTVLHFWEYRDSPLQEPYGQVGYLDYLHRKRKADGVSVFGVAVDRQFADPSTRRQAASSAKKLRSFMNLSYPLLWDDGTVVKMLGDPRQVGTKLPLYVVIGPDGKVIHYHAGLYEVDRDRGLKELDDAVSKALESRN